MGSGIYRESDLLARKMKIVASGKDTFARTVDIREGKERAECHPLLRIDTEKLRIRESRDSATHPKSNSLALWFDVTGSMGQVPKDLEVSLKDLMGYFLKSNYLPNVAILFGAVGDSTCDRVPFQVGQFEPGAQELMDFFQRVFLEGGGGGQNTESYQNALYFMARHTILDCFEKRGKKGYIVMFGDELPYDKVNTKEIKKLMGGVGPEKDIPLAQIVKEAQEKYVVLFVIPLGTSGGQDPEIWNTWQSLLGKECVLGMERTEQVCELVGTAVGICEGKVGVQDAVENLRKKGFGNKYLEIAKESFQKLYGVNKDKVSDSKKPANGAKPTGTGAGDGNKPNKPGKKKGLKI